MALLYIANTSLDGFTEDEQGRFDFTEPDDDVFASITDLIRPVGTHLYGRRMYETMAVWETDPSLAEQPAQADFANVWQAADKVVYSTTLAEPTTARTRIERAFDADAVRALTRSASADVMIGGPNLAAHALRAGVVDDIHLYVSSVVIGGGKPALPAGWRTELELADEHRFASGVIHLHYRPARRT